jgi:hypothetical protein
MDEKAFGDFVLSLYKSGPEFNQFKRNVNLVGDILFNVLITKYPEYYWCEKYIMANKCTMVPELGCIFNSLSISSSLNQGMDAIWSKNVKASFCASLLKALNKPLTTMIRQKNGTQHIILIVGYDEEEQQLIVHDSLGNYHTDYTNPYGAYIPFTFEEIEQIGIGNPMSFFCVSPAKERTKVIRMLCDIDYYEITAEELLIFSTLAILSKFALLDRRIIKQKQKKLFPL